MRVQRQDVQGLLLGMGLALVLGLAATGCGSKKTAEVFTLQPQEVAILAAADRADGQADKVVSQCASCQLHMAGKPEHALQAGDYAMHFCSESCKTRFAEDLHASIQGLQPPAE